MKPKLKSHSTKSNPGIKTIAEALGISIATVDRALHQRGRISEKTRARVLRMAEKLDYKPNLAARHLRLNQRFKISVNLPKGRTSFFDFMRAGIEEGAMPFRSALDIEFNSYPESGDHAKESVLKALDAGANGIIAAPPNTLETIDWVRDAQQNGVPLICVSTDVPESARLTAVTAHPFSCGAMAAEILADYAKPRSSQIILTGTLKNLNHTEKLRGFKTMLSRISPGKDSIEVVEAHDNPREAYRQLRRLFQGERKMSGLYITSSKYIAALQAMREVGCLGIVPIVTTDVFAELIPYLREGLVKATIYQCPETQGSAAIRTMYRYLSEGAFPEHSIHVVPQLVMRSNLDLYLKNGAGIAPANAAI